MLIGRQCYAGVCSRPESNSRQQLPWESPGEESPGRKAHWRPLRARGHTMQNTQSHYQGHILLEQIQKLLEPKRPQPADSGLKSRAKQRTAHGGSSAVLPHSALPAPVRPQREGEVEQVADTLPSHILHGSQSRVKWGPIQPAGYEQK